MTSLFSISQVDSSTQHISATGLEVLVTDTGSGEDGGMLIIV